MEIKINIEKNNYVQPTEVREEIVQHIVDAIIKSKVDCEWHNDLEFAYTNPTCGIYKSTRQGGYGISGAGLQNFMERVRGCEMKAAFTAIQDAGYYIYGFINMKGETSYHFSTKPYYRNRKAERIDFDLFID